MSKILKNSTGSDIELSVLGLTVPLSSQTTIEVEDYLILGSEDSITELTTLINSGDIIISDGTNDLGASDGINYIKYSENASSILYNNINSQLTANTTQKAVDEVKSILDALPDEMPVVQGRFTTLNAIVPSTYTSIPFSTNDVTAQSDVIDINPASDTDIRLKESGVYIIGYHVTTFDDGNPDEMRMRAVVNGSTVIGGSQDATGDCEAGNGSSSLEISFQLNRTFLYNATVNDVVNIQWETDAGHINLTPVTVFAVKLDAQFANFIFEEGGDQSRADLIGGGVSELVQTTNQVMSGTARTIVNWGTQDLFDSTCFTHTPGASEVTLDKAGSYRIYSTINIQRTANGRVQGNALWQSATSVGAFIDIEKSYSHCYTRSSDASNFGSCTTVFTYQASVGDRLRAAVFGNEGPAVANILGTRTNVVIEYIGV